MHALALASLYENRQAVDSIPHETHKLVWLSIKFNLFQKLAAKLSWYCIINSLFAFTSSRVNPVIELADIWMMSCSSGIKTEN